MSKNLSKFNKKEKLAIFSFSIIVLISLLTITGSLPLASLFGGDSDNVIGGTFTASASTQSGETTTSFAESGITQIEFEITNNANDPYILTGQPYDVQGYVITSTEDSTDHQVEINLIHQSGMNSDLSNVRFQLADGTNLPQYRESYTSDDSATYWIKTDLVTGSNNVYVVYGGDLPLKSNPELVYDYYDDCTSTDGWTGSTGYLSITEEGLKLHEATSSSYTMYKDLGGSYSDIIFEFKQKKHNAGHNQGAILELLPTNTLTNRFTVSEFWYSGSWIWRAYSSGSFTNFDTTGAYDTWYVGKQVVRNTDSQWDYYVYNEDGSLKSSDTGNSWAIGSPSGSVTYLGMHTPSTDYTSTTYEYFRIRKYMATEPTSEMMIGTQAALVDGGFPFTHMKVLTIDNTGNGALSGYQQLETITYESAMQVGMDDIVFTETDGTIIPHFTKLVTASTSAEVFIKIDADADSIKQINMYYGNSQVPDMSDSSIFEFYDDFDESALDNSKWTVSVGSGCSYSITNGALKSIAGASVGNRFSSIETFTQPVTLETRTKVDGVVYAYTRLSDNDASFDPSPCIQTVLNSDSGKGYIMSQKDGGSIDYSSNWVDYAGETTYHKYGINIDETHISQTIDDLIKYENDVTNTFGTLYVRLDAYGNTNPVYWDWVRVRQYTATPPTISFGSEKALVNPTITASCTGDSNSQTYGLETKSITLTPTSDISQFVVDGSLDYDFTATLHYADATTVTTQNSTTGDITFTFTPTVALDSGYANAIFDQDIILEYPEITATLDGESVNAVFENNNTVSIELRATDVSEHTVIASVVNNAPSTPVSSGGGGGGSAPAPSTTTENSTVSNDIVESTISEQNLDFNIFNTDTNNLIIYSALIIIIMFGAVLYSRQK